jgi:hypothetical protein
MATRPTIDDAIAALERVAEQVTDLGIERVADQAKLKPTQVRKFVNDVMRSKNSEIRLISAAVAALQAKPEN